MNMEPQTEEKKAPSLNGMSALVLNIVLMIASLAALVMGIIAVDGGSATAGAIVLLAAGGAYSCLLGPVLFAGLKVLKPNEALVLTLFGRYYGTLRGPGFFFVHPLAVAACPAFSEPTSGAVPNEKKPVSALVSSAFASASGGRRSDRKITLKAMTLNNDKQKVNDVLGNPIIIGIVVVWKVVNTAKAVFNVNNYTEYLSIQCDSALRNIVRLYPYDASDEEAKNPCAAAARR
jgi:hypothetical protein